MAKKYESRKEGLENINGMECEKQMVLADKEIIHAAWISKKLNYPIKLVTYYEGKERSVCELKNIKPGNLPKNMFKPPADFKQKEDPAAAEERKREEQRKAEEALPGITKTASARVPKGQPAAGVQGEGERKYIQDRCDHYQPVSGIGCA